MVHCALFCLFKSVTTNHAVVMFILNHGTQFIATQFILPPTLTKIIIIYTHAVCSSCDCYSIRKLGIVWKPRSALFWLRSLLSLVTVAEYHQNHHTITKRNDLATAQQYCLYNQLNVIH